jgi:hypothetical protein
VSRSWHRSRRTVLHGGRDGLPQGVGGIVPGRDSRACQSRGVHLRCQGIKRPYTRLGAWAACVQVPSSETVLV